MNKTRGLMLITDPAFGCQEVETFTCKHCQRVEDKPPFKTATSEGIGAWCSCCDAPICLRCEGKPCIPIERWLDRQEARRSYEESSK